MGSDSDLSVMMEAVEKLKQFRIPYEVRIISAHRTPAWQNNSPPPPRTMDSASSSPAPQRLPIES